MKDIGMFDRIIFTCPTCHTPIEEQSKAGKCNLLQFSETAVPLSIASDIKGNILHCGNCKGAFIIRLSAAPDVPMRLEKQ